MKKLVNILIIFILLMTTGCLNKDVVRHEYTFKGESESWRAEFKLSAKEIFKDNNKVKYTSTCDKLLTVTYKNDLSELDQVKRIEISYETGTSGGSTKEDYDNEVRPHKVYYHSSSSTNGSIEKKDEIIKVTINVDGNIETMEIKAGK
ncbi:MAG: hypothetical protein ACRCXA_08020 [Peptostreptococcaceae bacterium]